MKHAQRTLVSAAAAVAVIVAGTAASAAPAQHGADRGKLQERLDHVVDVGAVGALAEVRDERGVWRGTGGVAELGTERAVPARGHFRVGSISKTFVATVVLQLVDEGELGLDDTVESWLPGVVPGGEGMTVRQLLNHTSGVYDYVSTLPMPPGQEFVANRWRTWTPDELVRRAVANPPSVDPPGSRYSYSNTGYLLLGRIVEKATGRSYAEEIEQRVIEPLRLRGTSVPGTSPRVPQPRPRAYLPVEPGGTAHPTDYTEMNPSVFGAAGEMISTTRDLNRFVAALLDGSLVPDHLLAEMKKPGAEGATYGLGLDWYDTTCGVRVYGNDGDALAYQAWSYSTEDGRRQATVGLTSDRPADPADAVHALLDEAFCD
ncbi:serine hydrolase domain-containing protein [Streptomyces sp. NPDC057137]|uniref:serine hydrolase domain-containing protein n=1 Tax=Streptomyces sp. NPDC057137 TaxID=3346030 RepID=UPI003643A4F0